MRTHLDVKHTGNIDGERTRMSFDENSLAHLMSILTDLYADPAMAVIREYSTNARDSHVAAGCPERPIRIEVPSRLNSMFAVEDWGVGMSADDVREQFSKYGLSTKRDSDEFNGILGIGCKSGLAYAGQFTFYTTKDGWSSIVLVTREEDGAGSIQVLDETFTAKPNGTRIEIPIADPNSFVTKIHSFFRFWRPGTVEIIGTEVPSIWADHEGKIKVDDEVLLFRDGAGVIHDSYIVMGGVAYPIGSENGLSELFLGNRRGNGYNHKPGFYVVAEVEIGLIDFAPSREALQYSKRTKELLEELDAHVVRRIAHSVNAELQAIEDPRDAWLYANQSRQLFKQLDLDLIWRGRLLPSEYIEIDSGSGNVWTLPRVKTKGAGQDRADRFTTVRCSPATGTANDVILYVEDFNARALTQSIKEKVRVWLNRDAPDRERIQVKRIVFLPTRKMDNLLKWEPFIRGRMRVPFSVIADTEIVKGQKRSFIYRYIDSEVTYSGRYHTGGYCSELHRGEDEYIPPVHDVIAWSRLNVYKTNGARLPIGRLLGHYNSAKTYDVATDGRPPNMRQCKPVVAIIAATEERAWMAAHPEVPRLDDLLESWMIETALTTKMSLAEDILAGAGGSEPVRKALEALGEAVEAIEDAAEGVDRWRGHIIDTIVSDAVVAWKEVHRDPALRRGKISNHAFSYMKEVMQLEENPDRLAEVERFVLEILEIRMVELHDVTALLLECIQKYPLLTVIKKGAFDRRTVDYLNAMFVMTNGFANVNALAYDVTTRNQEPPTRPKRNRR